MKRTEPTQALIPRGNQKRLAYVSANDTDIRARFDAMRKPQKPVLIRKEKQA